MDDTWRFGEELLIGSQNLPRTLDLMISVQCGRWRKKNGNFGYQKGCPPPPHIWETILFIRVMFDPYYVKQVLDTEQDIFSYFFLTFCRFSTNNDDKLQWPGARFNAIAQHRWKTCCQKYIFICLRLLIQLQVFKRVFCEIFPKCSHFFLVKKVAKVWEMCPRKWKLWVMVLQWFIAALSWKWCRCLSCHFLQLLIWEIERILCKIWSGQLLFDALDPLLCLLLLAIHSATNILQLLQLLQLNVKLKEHTYKTFDK